jgi:hypothetical protein
MIESILRSSEGDTVNARASESRKISNANAAEVSSVFRLKPYYLAQVGEKRAGENGADHDP